MLEYEVVEFVGELTPKQRKVFSRILDNLEETVEPVDDPETVEEVARQAIEDLEPVEVVQ